MDIRRAAPADVPAILEIFRIAKAYMAAHGNAGQWGGDYPGLPDLLPDIARGHSYVLTDGGVIVGTFSFIIGDEPTYRMLLNGHWHAHHPPPGLQGNRQRRGPGLFFLLPRHHGLCPHRHP